MSGGLHNPYDDTALMAAIAVIDNEIADLDADFVLLQADVDAIQALVEAEGILEETGGTITTDGTEQNVYINNAPGGVYKPLSFNIDFSNQTATETVTIRTYYRTDDGGGWVQDDSFEFDGEISPALVRVELYPARYGCRVTIEKTAGTNRAYVWEVFYEA